ncbi:hypothetical protein EFA69_02600 [Rufibacter immobilis]|uniref:Uncharacterized protein n=1 Tax=Rufibacter immobilis TaxID=1348778 RepID=A0A3M9N496_9BACT|nr:hypothetical protein [Rufibacter immobilis]RNI32235.1 hypothetical protein EFA69_02600 [Rufibacter immobilis]
MPSNLNTAIDFLETQWSSINDNKLKGINAEIRLEAYLKSPLIKDLYRYIIPGGWIIAPGSNAVLMPTKARIAVLPNSFGFSWTKSFSPSPFTAQTLASSFFNQVGIETYFANFDPSGRESRFDVPRKKNYNTTYELEPHLIGSSGLEKVDINVMMRNFPRRKGLVGMRAYKSGRIDRKDPVWSDSSLVTHLFWKEYSRYFLQRNYLVSSNDLDFFIIGKSGKAYPIELKSKRVYADAKLGDWFGIDIGPFSKLSFFVSLSNNMEALYLVEEVDDLGGNIEWWGVRFSEVLKYCFWVTQSGGASMGGGRSNTIKVPKEIFTPLHLLLPTL